jgi:hypothetical protein
MQPSPKRNKGSQIDDTEFDGLLKVLEDTFSLTWLKQNKGNPLQILWQRTDNLASNELITLAMAIQNLNQIDANWVKGQVKHIKGKDTNNCRGALFELNCLNILHNKLHPVKPAVRNQAGYDGVLYGSHENYRVSIKNYGKSTFQKQFETQARTMESMMKILLKKYDYPPSHIILDFPEEYPEKRHWKLLEDNMDSIFKGQRTSSEPFSALVEAIDPTFPAGPGNTRTLFLIFIYPIKNPPQPFHPHYTSYTVMISGAYHANEERNLFSKLEDACANLTKHAVAEDAQSRNCLFLRLPETVSLARCTDWLNNYFTSYPAKPISMVILYQPVVATDIANNSSDITHCVNFYHRDIYQPQSQFTFQIPIGKVSDKSTDLIYVAKYPDGRSETIALINRYIYQHGEHYVQMTQRPDGSLAADINYPADGVTTNVIVQLPGQKKAAIMKGKFPPSNELLIL